MRKILCVALALLLAGGSALAAGAPGNRLGMSILAALCDGTRNQFVSPVSLAGALSMAAEGAAGETRAALLSALEAEDPEAVRTMNAALREAGLRWANAAFADGEWPLKADYIDALKALYEAETFPLDSLERVNAWASAHTDGLIDPLLAALPDPKPRLMLMNAIAMDAKWQTPFEESGTWEDAFHAPEGDVRAEFMHDQRYADYAEADGVQCLRLGYRDCGLAMFVALPPEGGVPALLEALAERGLDYFSFPEESTEIILSLPKLDLTATNGLAETLKALGLELPFTAAADFSGISDTQLMIDEVLQKVRVQVDEEGTRAAAVTAIMMAKGAAPAAHRPIEMKVDRPFALLIADETTGAICFAGVVANPLG